LDLHEKTDGPHMLVAGTTGSGKTETIISYLLGLCMQYRPDELNLLLVDMKGGGFTKRIGHLPHVVGAVTDVDGDENGTGAEYMLSRFLYAMKAEIKRRKLLFNKLHVDSIDAYIQACKDIEGHIEKKKIGGAEAEGLRATAKNDSLAHLILVVDEFTELKRFTNENSEIDFMGEITTIARVGRSLGFHIILISQNIEGAITEDIRVNSKARLCLKVATRQASKDMIGTELAASPFMPGNGRAYLLVGTGSKFEYFQSAYSGASTEEIVPVEITLASKTGAFSCFYRSDKDNLTLRKRMAELKKLGMSKTQLETISDVVCSVYRDNRDAINAPHIVFSTPLPTCITWDHTYHAVIEVDARKKVD
jgi:S-DNA-T family DNA segregation ATPase FtsK/SpoIIIE